MASPTSARRKLYVYAITAAASGDGLGPLGVEGGVVRFVTAGGLSAVVSDVPERLRPERSQIAAHQAVLRRLMVDVAAVLPVSFGLVADDRAAILRLLTRNRKALLEQLHRVAGRVEMGLRVVWDVPNIFEYFVSTHPELRAVRDRFFGGHRELTLDDKIEVGRVFDRILNEDREVQAQSVEKVLAPHCDEMRRNGPRNEREVLSLACLVDRECLTQFEAAVFEAAKRFDNNYAFDYNGPWAAHNFVDLALEL